jgi:hypothetical protein
MCVLFVLQRVLGVAKLGREFIVNLVLQHLEKIIVFN